MSESVNKSIQNKYISHKILKYKLIIKTDILLQTPLNEIDFDRFEKERERYIFERQTTIAKQIQSDLPLGRVLIK